MNPAEAADQGIDPKLLKKAAEYIETRLPLARSMIIIKNGKTVHEKYYWKGGPQEKDYPHSLNGPILHALLGIAIGQLPSLNGQLYMAASSCIYATIGAALPWAMSAANKKSRTNSR